MAAGFADVGVRDPRERVLLRLEQHLLAGAAGVFLALATGVELAARGGGLRGERVAGAFHRGEGGEGGAASRPARRRRDERLERLARRPGGHLQIGELTLEPGDLIAQATPGRPLAADEPARLDLQRPPIRAHSAWLAAHRFRKQDRHLSRRSARSG